MQVEKTLKTRVVINYGLVNFSGTTAGSGVSIGIFTTAPGGRGIKPLSASGGLVRLRRIKFANTSCFIGSTLVF